MKKLLFSTLTAAFGALIMLAMPLAAKAAGTTIVVTPANNDGWATADTRPGGNVSYVNDPSSPMPSGALQLTTDSTNDAKAQYMHTANTALADTDVLSYSTYQKTASSPTGDPSYQLVVCLSGYTNNTCNGFDTLVYEPYWNTANQTVTPNTWQTWIVSDGQFWSSGSYTDSSNANCTVTAGHGGTPFYTLSDLKTACPNATVVGFGVNVGTYNPNYVVETDQIVFNQYTYDFQLTNAPTSKDQCKNNGYATATDENGTGFKNQGQCVSYFNHSTPQHMTLSAVSVNNKDDKAAYNAGTNSGSNSNNSGNNTNTTTNGG
ncbi:MAG TPA: hypothetical protein VFP32_03595 [Candidatus Saccharimonadales bacterium]|nr:hypothetical protein [Candidatus Saccharimonadales bacterium]